jgi:VWFA-related protein
MAGWEAGVSAPFARAQQPAAQSASAADTTGTTIKAEARLVLVDTIVTDKKGNYLGDLSEKDFRVWEDDKEQAIRSFSFEAKAGPGAPEQRHYLVLFFDNATMDMGDQIRARAAAAKFIAANAGPNRLMAIVEFTGAAHVIQNFTADAARLQKVVAGVKTSNVDPNAQPVEVASLGAPSLFTGEADFGQRSVLLALRNMAKNLSNVPGRKSLVFLTSGFPVSLEIMSELTATIATCNKANVAVYPIDVRGLIVGGPSAASGGPGARLRYPAVGHSAALQTATFHPGGSGTGTPYGGANLVYVQHGGGGGGGVGGGGGGGHGGGGGTGGGGTSGGGGHGGGTTGGTGGGGRGGGVGSPTSNGYNNNYNYNYLNSPQARLIIPQPPVDAMANQQILYQLAGGTGGFVIVNTNDLLSGLEKIAREQTQYYILGYSPAVSAEGTCHIIKVKVTVSGAIVRSRSGYCNVRPVDLLAGKPIEKELEGRATGSQAGNVAATMLLPYVYTSGNTARVDLAMEIPTAAIQFSKEKGKQHAEINVLGIASKADGSVAARFSDTVTFDFEGKKQVEEFQKRPFHYENQFGIGSGQYTLKVAFSSGGESYGKIEAPLVVDPYDVKQFSLSGLVLSREVRRSEDMAAGLQDSLLSDHTALMVMGMQIVPTGSNRFSKTDFALLYAEIYEPLQVNPPASPLEVSVSYVVVDRKNGQKPIDSMNPIDLKSLAKPGNLVIPVGFKIPADKLPPGSYRAEMQAIDNAGHSSPLRAVEFEVE